MDELDSLRRRFEDFDKANNGQQERLVQLEERAVEQVKHTDLQALNVALSKVEEQRQRSDSSNGDALEDLKIRLERQEAELDSAVKPMINDLRDSINNLGRQTEDLVKNNVNENVGEAIRQLREGDFSSLKDLVDDKLNEVDHKCKTNEGHVENLRELNSKLLDEIQKQVDDELEKQKKATDEIKKDHDDNKLELKKDIDEKFANIKDFRKEDVDELKKAKEDLEKEMENVRDNIGHLEQTVGKVEEEQENVITEFNNTKVKTFFVALTRQKFCEGKTFLPFFQVILQTNVVKEVEQKFLSSDGELRERVGGIEDQLKQILDDKLNTLESSRQATSDVITALSKLCKIYSSSLDSISI